jgi:hypothetical protein
LRAFFIIALALALSFGSAAAKPRSPCDVVTRAELAGVLGGKPVSPDPSTIGEETAPSCIWTTASGARVKIEIWSGDALRVVGEKTAARYFVSRGNEAVKSGGTRVKSVGEAAYRTAFDHDLNGEIGVLKTRRFLVFAFEGVPYSRALKFARAVVRRA